MKNSTVYLSVLLSSFYLQALTAEENFPKKIDQCVACHGAIGHSSYSLFPHLAGQKKVYIISQLKAFRDGTRSNPWMTPIAVPLDDNEIEELASFYAEL
ncbi:MAG: cytochrome c [Gammaproteobacteria bacterium]|nr:cytochrome c [Gammaproteobacteria bacterium]